VKAETPGAEQKDVSVSLENQILIVKGEKHKEKPEAPVEVGVRWRRREMRSAMPASTRREGACSATARNSTAAVGSQ
jgi:HSP20 family molecular chaperone IbpA